MALRTTQTRHWRRGRSTVDDSGTKKLSDSVLELLAQLNSRLTSVAGLLTLLNSLVKLAEDTNKNGLTGFTTEEVLYCLRPCMVHEFTQVRAGTWRVVRRVLKTSRDLQVFNELQLNHLLCRSMDILLDNEEERIQSLKLIRKMLSVSPDVVSSALIRSLVSLSENGVEDGDRMLRAYLAALCEIGVLNPKLLILCGGVGAITRNVLECHSPRIAESLCGVLLHLLEWPQTRNIAGVRLDCLAAPYCDFTYRLGIMDKNKHARDLRFTCSRLALLSVLRSWAGTIEFCNPNKASGLKAIVDVLYLNQVEVRKAILDLFYELLGLPQPIWTDEYSVAISAIDPADYQDSWRLSEGFVAMEGRNVLPSLAIHVPNISEIHTSILLYCFLETGLLNALVEVVVSSAAFISVRATVLLGKLLQLMYTHLPADICNTSSALPSLVTYASQGNHQASAAISALQALHQIFKNRPASCSPYLDLIIQSGAISNSHLFKREIESSDKLTLQSIKLMERSRLDSIGSSTSNSGDEPYITGNITLRGGLKKKKILNLFDGNRQSESLMKESNIFTNDDGKKWDWEIIITLLSKVNPTAKLDVKFIRFLRRLVHFFKPSSNRFSHQDLVFTRYMPPYVTAGIKLVDWLLECSEVEPIRLLTEYFTDIDNQLHAICTAKSAHDCLFSPQHMNSTMCQQYFLFVGRMCRTKIGVNILVNTQIFKHLIQIVTTTIHICYIKLIVSGLDYNFDSKPRQVLEKALSESDRTAGRLYATQFMLVLMRAKIPNFEIWGLPLLIKQIRDRDTTVSLQALEILHESCHDRAYLEELVSIWPDVSSIGDSGRLLMARFYSIPRGLNHTKAKIQHELEYWINGYNKRYALLVEADIHSTLTLHTKNESGTYSRRSCSSLVPVTPPNILPHLYGQLVQTTQGLENLLKFGNLQRLLEILAHSKCNDEADILSLKSTLWALGHMSTSTEGVELLSNQASRVYEKIISLAKHCEVYSIRATALHVLSLVGSTKAGANLLFKYDWLCVRHDRDTLWPACESEDWLSKHLTPIRHQISKVPPYNYTGIDQNINVIFGSSDGSTPFYVTDSGDNTKELDKNESFETSSNNRIEPGSNTKQHMALKHKRSLSESKSADGANLMITMHHVGRTRFNSSTDSNTSGVSSFESVFGIALSDIYKALSPIPSSSNLMVIGKTNERFRRISLTGASFREYSLSPQDAQGYAKLRSIRRYQRPMFSESAADELADIIDNNVSISNKLTIEQQPRRLKVRSLDRHSNLVPLELDALSGFGQTNEMSCSTPYGSNVSYVRGPCYSGICLPKNILEIFPNKVNLNTYVSCCVQDNDANESPTTMKQQFIADYVSEFDESSGSSLSDLSSTTSKRPKWTGNRHNQHQCLLCCRKLSSSLSFAKDNSMLLRSLRTNGTEGVDVLDSASSMSVIQRLQKKSHINALSIASDLPLNSPESLMSEDLRNERINLTILKYVQRISNPVWVKQSKLALYKIKQRHPQYFQDVCFYSEICKALSSNSYSLNARRFLQELFLDVDYTLFYHEAVDIINTKKEVDDLSNSSFGDIIEKPNLTINTSIASVDVTDSSTTQSGVVDPLTDKDYNNINLSPTIVPLANHTAKAHIAKSPPLASVYETSRENLCDSLGNSSKSKTTDLKITYAFEPKSIEENLKIIQIDNEKEEKLTPKSIEFDENNLITNNNNTSNNSDNSNNSNTDTDNSVKLRNNTTEKKHTRPRFNTLELDLSCSKNKFPIKHRLKTSYSATTTTAITTPTSSNSLLNSQRIIKSLSASITTPPNILYCEKRMKSSKSEAILSSENRDQHESLGSTTSNS